MYDELIVECLLFPDKMIKGETITDEDRNDVAINRREK